MRQTISGLVAAIAVVAASAVPAMACGVQDGARRAAGLCQRRAAAGLCRRPRSIPAATAAAAGPMSGCPIRCSSIKRQPDPVQQYYYVNQGPTYTGPGNFAPYPAYRGRRGVRLGRLSPSSALLRLPAIMATRRALRPRHGYARHAASRATAIASICCAAITDRSISESETSTPVRILRAGVFLTFSRIRPSRLAPI